MHVWPGADADGVDAFVFQQLLPVVVHGRDVELVSDSPSRFAATVGYSRNLQPSDLVKTGNIFI